MIRSASIYRRLLTAAAVVAVAGVTATWSVAQTQGSAAAPAGAPPSAASVPTAQAPSPASAAGSHSEAEPSHFPAKLPAKMGWSFGGFFGKFDQAQLQRGYQVYKEVCSNCHSMNLIAFRNLGDHSGPHFEEAAVRALAAGYTVTDGPDDGGDMFQRPGRPSDYFPSPFANVQAAAASNGGAAPPDLSVIAKARAPEHGLLSVPIDFVTGYQEAGVDYIYALLTGFTDAPAGVKVPEGTYYNPYFISGVSLKMPPILTDGHVKYTDGSPQTIGQYAKDVSAFLMWTAEPRLVERKEIGFRTLLFLAVFAVLMYLTKRRVWSKVAH